MRAMRQTIALCALLLAGAGCGDDNNGGPDMSMPDLAVGADLAVRTPDGVACGGMTCSVGQSCCVMASGQMTTSTTCIGAGGNCNGGAVLACDGPEDCGSGMQYCCGTIQFSGGTPDGGAVMFGGGNSSCTGSCDFTFQQGSVKTRLCHADVDCTGLSAFGMNLDKCCSSTQAPGLHFCAAALAGITCP